jgi:hypothetical protein
MCPCLRWSIPGRSRRVNSIGPVKFRRMSASTSSAVLDDLSGWKIGQIHHPPQDRLARGRHAEPCAEPCSKVAGKCPTKHDDSLSQRK